MNSEVGVVIVTGASRGIGQAVVEHFLKKEFKVICCSRSEPNYDAFATSQGSALYVPLDLADDSSVADCARVISQSEKRIDVLVNCAGVASGGLFLMTPMSHALETFRINYFNTLLFTQYIAKKMIRAKAGSIINISSTSGILSDKGTLGYGGSKAALDHSTRVMAAELGAYGIRVNSIAPSVVETNMAALMDRDALSQAYSRRALPGRLIYAEDIAELVVFLGSDASSNITGEIIKVDCGATL